MEVAADDKNIQMMNERKNREKLEKQKQIEEERRELDLLNQRMVQRVLPNQR